MENPGLRGQWAPKEATERGDRGATQPWGNLDQMASLALLALRAALACRAPPARRGGRASRAPWGHRDREVSAETQGHGEPRASGASQDPRVRMEARGRPECEGSRGVRAQGEALGREASRARVEQVLWDLRVTRV